LFILTKFCWLLHIFGSLCSVDYYSIIVQLFQWILLIIFNILVQEEEEETYKKQFSRFIKNGINANNIEEMYKKAHAAIRADPTHKAPAKKSITKKRHNAKKIGLAARKAKIAKAKEEFLSQIEAQKE